MADLESPQNPDELYRYRGSETCIARPVFQGDVFEDIEIPGLDDGPGLAIVLTHPCTMRGKYSALRPILTAGRVKSYREVTLPWYREFKVLPLPNLLEGSTDSYAAFFDEAGLVKATDLDVRRRVACLDDRGVLLLQQRQAHHFTRHVVETESLFEHTAGLLTEAELFEEWIEASVPDDAEAWLEQRDIRTKEFDEFIEPHRRNLNQISHHASVRTMTRKEIAERFG